MMPGGYGQGGQDPNGRLPPLLPPAARQLAQVPLIGNAAALQQQQAQLQQHHQLQQQQNQQHHQQQQYPGYYAAGAGFGYQVAMPSQYAAQQPRAANYVAQVAAPQLAAAPTHQPTLGAYVQTPVPPSQPPQQLAPTPQPAKPAAAAPSPAPRPAVDVDSVVKALLERQIPISQICAKVSPDTVLRVITNNLDLAARLPELETYLKEQLTMSMQRSQLPVEVPAPTTAHLPTGVNAMVQAHHHATAVPMKPTAAAVGPNHPVPAPVKPVDSVVAPAAPRAPSSVQSPPPPPVAAAAAAPEPPAQPTCIIMNHASRLAPYPHAAYPQAPPSYATHVVQHMMAHAADRAPTRYMSSPAAMQAPTPPPPPPPAAVPQTGSAMTRASSVSSFSSVTDVPRRATSYSAPVPTGLSLVLDVSDTEEDEAHVNRLRKIEEEAGLVKPKLLVPNGRSVASGGESPAPTASAAATPVVQEDGDEDAVMEEGEVVDDRPAAASPASAPPAPPAADGDVVMREAIKRKADDAPTHELEQLTKDLAAEEAAAADLAKSLSDLHQQNRELAETMKVHKAQFEEVKARLEATQQKQTESLRQTMALTLKRQQQIKKVAEIKAKVAELRKQDEARGLAKRQKLEERERLLQKYKQLVQEQEALRKPKPPALAVKLEVLLGQLAAKLATDRAVRPVPEIAAPVDPRLEMMEWVDGRWVVPSDMMTRAKLEQQCGQRWSLRPVLDGDDTAFQSAQLGTTAAGILDGVLHAVKPERNTEAAAAQPWEELAQEMAFKPYNPPPSLAALLSPGADSRRDVNGVSHSNSTDAATGTPMTDVTLCPFESSGGACNDGACPYTHFRELDAPEEWLGKKIRLATVRAYDPAALIADLRTAVAACTTDAEIVYAVTQRCQESVEVLDIPEPTNPKHAAPFLQPLLPVMTQGLDLHLQSTLGRLPPRYWSYILDEAEYEDQLKGHPHNVELWLDYAISTLPPHANEDAVHSATNKQYHRTLSILRRGLQENPTSYDLWPIYLDLLLRKESVEHVRETFEQAVKHLPTHWSVWWMYAQWEPVEDKRVALYLRLFKHLVACWHRRVPYSPVESNDDQLPYSEPFLDALVMIAYLVQRAMGAHAAADLLHDVLTAQQPEQIIDGQVFTQTEATPVDAPLTITHSLTMTVAFAIMSKRDLAIAWLVLLYLKVFGHMPQYEGIDVSARPVRHSPLFYEGAHAYIVRKQPFTLRPYKLDADRHLAAVTSARALFVEWVAMAKDLAGSSKQPSVVEIAVMSRALHGLMGLEFSDEAGAQYAAKLPVDAFAVPAHPWMLGTVTEGRWTSGTEPDRWATMSAPEPGDHTFWNMVAHQRAVAGDQPGFVLALVNAIRGSYEGFSVLAQLSMDDLAMALELYRHCLGLTYSVPSQLVIKERAPPTGKMYTFLWVNYALLLSVLPKDAAGNDDLSPARCFEEALLGGADKTWIWRDFLACLVKDHSTKLARFALLALSDVPTETPHPYPNLVAHTESQLSPIQVPVLSFPWTQASRKKFQEHIFVLKSGNASAPAAGSS
ncbi:Zinc finger C3H1 domain-containing protein [Allomyces arbusculus]|nr:Zinc finger C3H1 domain-containing protein [Allomyces arbusculus]